MTATWFWISVLLVSFLLSTGVLLVVFTSGSPPPAGTAALLDNGYRDIRIERIRVLCREKGEVAATFAAGADYGRVRVRGIVCTGYWHEPDIHVFTTKLQEPATP